MAGVEGAMRLADFLSDLRNELEAAQEDAREHSLKLGVDEITVTLDLAFSATTSGELSGKATARFLVFFSAEAAAKAAASGQWSRTHQVTLTLKPRLEEKSVGPQGEVRTVTRDLDVRGGLAAGEENPELPEPTGT